MSKNLLITALVLVIGIVLGIIGGFIIFGTSVQEKTVPTTVTRTLIETRTATKTMVYTQVLKTTALKTLTITRTKEVTKISTYPVHVVDALGRSVVIDKQPQRVVSLAPSITEILFALGLGDKVVGVDQASNYPPELVERVKRGEIAVVGAYWSPDMEKILRLKPDLVLADAGAHLKYLSKFEELGLKVVFLRGGRCKDLDDVYSDIMLVSRIFNVVDRGIKIVDEIKNSIESIKEIVKKYNLSAVKVMVLLGPPQWGYWVAGGGTFIDNMLELIGVHNVFRDKFGWVKVDKEEIVKKNPDVIIVTAMWPSSKENALKTLKALAKDPLLAKVKAVRNGLVYVVFGDAQDTILRPGPRIAIGIRILASIVYPHVFKIEKQYQECIVSLKELRSGVKV